MRKPTRREFLRAALGASVALPVASGFGGGPTNQRTTAPDLWGLGFPDPAVGWRGDSSVAAALRAGQSLQSFSAPFPQVEAKPATSLRERFADLDRHFIFDYYPWYGADPWRHWNNQDRFPPDDIAATSVPHLGPYDSKSTAVLERHARWIAESSVGAIALSWWGRGSYEDAAVPLVMDVMKAHDIKVTFGLEPYANDRGSRYAQDILYLLREFGEKRGWDAFLVLKNEDGEEGPVFKGFRLILPREIVDCHGITHRVPDFTPDGVWRRQTDGLRKTLRRDFDHITLLADSLDFGRTPASGFDGVAIYDNSIEPDRYAGFAAGASRRDLLFSFNTNPGFDGIEPRHVDPDSCYEPRPFVPPTEDLDWDLLDERDRAALLSAERIKESLQVTIRVQSIATLTNSQRGFFLVYFNSFNEWHEGHAFEPTKDWTELRAEERALGYHNPTWGDYRLATLSAELRDVGALSSPAP